MPRRPERPVVVPMRRPRPAARVRPARPRKPRRSRSGWNVRDLAVWIVLIAALVGLYTVVEHTPPAEGRAEVIDGDSLTVGGIEVRLLGVDAVEYAQQCSRNGLAWPCGREAAASLRRLAQGKGVECVASGRDIYGRRLAVCTTHDGFNLNREQVARGWALATGLSYGLAQREARAAKSGIWDSEFEPPRHHRAGG